jgi:two-component system NtrC family sensor kinase
MESDELIGRQRPGYYASKTEEAAIQRHLSANGHVTDFEARIGCADGTERWALCSLVRSTLDRDRIVITALHDVDDRKRAEDQLRSTLRELEQANERIQESHRQLLYAEKMAVLGTLVAGIAHEIKTPIGAINSMQHTLVRATSKLKSQLEETYPELLTQNKQLRTALAAIEDANQVIESGSGRVLEIVQRLRNFARLDACKREPFDVHAGLNDTLLLIHHETKNRISVERNYGALPAITANCGQLNQVFLNLLVNSVQAISGTGTIRITTSAAAGQVQIAIEDDGIGIPSESLERVFEPGYTTKGVGVGTGLGLAICRKIITEHDGEIAISSTKGSGTRVIISLPSDLPSTRTDRSRSCQSKAAVEEDSG